MSGWLEYSLLVKKSSLLSFAFVSGQILKLCPKKKSSAAYSFCKAMGLLGMQFHLFENECKNLQNTEISQFEFIHFVIKDVGFEQKMRSCYDKAMQKLSRNICLKMTKSNSFKLDKFTVVS